jgi:hypothetical protein
MKIAQTFCYVLLYSISFQSCTKGNKTNISDFDSNNSHKQGQNCMNFHKQNGNGKGWFTIAGTVYDSLKINTLKNITIKLYTGPNNTGTLVNTINADILGNFYTTNKIDFSAGLYTSVQGQFQINYMNSKIINGKCNECHGVTVDKIWTK